MNQRNSTVSNYDTRSLAFPLLFGLLVILLHECSIVVAAESVFSTSPPPPAPPPPPPPPPRPSAAAASSQPVEEKSNLKDSSISFDVGTVWVDSHGVLEIGRSLSAVLFFNESFVVVGGCLDPQCAQKSSTIDAYDPSTQFVTPIGEIPLFLDIPAPSTKLPPTLVRATVAGPHSVVIVQAPKSLEQDIFGDSSDHAEDAGLTQPPRPWLVGPCCLYNALEGNSSNALVKDLHGGAWGLSSDFSKIEVFYSFPPDVPIRANASCVSFGSLIYIIGGVLVDTLESVGTIDALDISTTTYMPNVATPLSPLMNPAVAIDNNAMYVVAGQRSTESCTPSSTNFLWKRPTLELNSTKTSRVSSSFSSTSSSASSTVFDETVGAPMKPLVHEVDAAKGNSQNTPALGVSNSEIAVCQSSNVVAYFFPVFYLLNQSQQLVAVMEFPDIPTELVVRKSSAPGHSSSSSSSSSGPPVRSSVHGAPDILRANSFGGWLVVSSHTEYTAALDLSFPLWFNQSTKKSTKWPQEESAEGKETTDDHFVGDNSLWTSSKISGVSLLDATVVFFPFQDLFFGVGLAMFCFGGVLTHMDPRQQQQQLSEDPITLLMSNRIYQRFVAGYLPHVWSPIQSPVLEGQSLNIGLQPPNPGLLRLSDNLECVGNAAGTSDMSINATSWSAVASVTFLPLFAASRVYVCYSSGPQMIVVPASIVFPTSAPSSSSWFGNETFNTTTTTTTDAPPTTTTTPAPAPTPVPQTFIFLSFFTVISPFSPFEVVAAPPPPPPPAPPLLDTVEIAVVATCAVTAVVFVTSVCVFVLVRARGAYLRDQEKRRALRDSRRYQEHHLLLQEDSPESGLYGGADGNGKKSRHGKRKTTKKSKTTKSGVHPRQQLEEEGNAAATAGGSSAGAAVTSSSRAGLWGRLKKLLDLASENDHQQQQHQHHPSMSQGGIESFLTGANSSSAGSRGGHHQLYAHAGPRRSRRLEDSSDLDPHAADHHHHHHSRHHGSDSLGGRQEGSDEFSAASDSSHESSSLSASSDQSSSSSSSAVSNNAISSDLRFLHPSDAFANRLLYEDPRDKLILNTTSVSRYKVIRKIGEGSFSSVYLVQRRDEPSSSTNKSGRKSSKKDRHRGAAAAAAANRAPPTYYAMKFMICADDRERLEAIKECETINSVQGHPGIIRLYDMFMNYEFEQKFGPTHPSNHKNGSPPQHGYQGFPPPPPQPLPQQRGLSPTTGKSSLLQPSGVRDPTAATAATAALSAADTAMILTASTRALQQQGGAGGGNAPIAFATPTAANNNNNSSASSTVHTRYLCLVMEYHPAGDLCRYVLRRAKELKQQRLTAMSLSLMLPMSPPPPAAALLAHNGGTAAPAAAAAASPPHPHHVNLTAAAGLFPSTPTLANSSSNVRGGFPPAAPTSQKTPATTTTFTTTAASPSTSFQSSSHPIPTHALSEQQLLGIAYQVASVLQYLHSQRPPIVHRDLKPENILIRGSLEQLEQVHGLSVGRRKSSALDPSHVGSSPTPSPVTPQSFLNAQRNNSHSGDLLQQQQQQSSFIPIAVTDFGLAFIQEEHRKSGRGGGTRPYISPESWKGQTTTASDVWSLGCVLFALATERLTTDTVRVMFQDAKSPQFSRTLLTELLRDHEYSAEFAVFVALMLDVDPKRRPTADRLVKMLELREVPVMRVATSTRQGGEEFHHDQRSPLMTTVQVVEFRPGAFGPHGAAAMVPPECLPQTANGTPSGGGRLPSSSSHGEDSGL